MATTNKDLQQQNRSSNSYGQRPQQNRRNGGGHHRPHAHNKRPHASSSSSTQGKQWSHNYEDDEVDDLIVAAQYAFAVPPTPPPLSTTLPDPELKQQQHPNVGSDVIDSIDENEIDLDDDLVVPLETFLPNDSFATMNDNGTKTEVDVDGTTNQSKDLSMTLCSIDIRPVFVSLRFGFKIGKTRERSRELRLSGENIERYALSFRLDV